MTTSARNYSASRKYTITANKINLTIFKSAAHKAALFVLICCYNVANVLDRSKYCFKKE